MKTLIAGIAVLGLFLAAGPAWASKPLPNAAYVQSGPDGVFYARCVPEAARGAKGVTTIHRVRKEGDEAVDTYGWYTRRGLVLGWSPIAGKVAVMAAGGAPGPEGKQPPALSFHLGGKLLASYSREDLKAWGADILTRASAGDELSPFNMVGCEQVPRTNDYRFVIEIDGKRLLFDVLTGKLVP